MPSPDMDSIMGWTRLQRLRASDPQKVGDYYFVRWREGGSALYHWEAMMLIALEPFESRKTGESFRWKYDYSRGDTEWTEPWESGHAYKRISFEDLSDAAQEFYVDWEVNGLCPSCEESPREFNDYLCYECRYGS